MKLVALPLVVILLASTVVAGWRLWQASDTYVIGGEYTVQAGQPIRGDLRAIFAQVSVPEGAHVDGRIFALSSALDLAGAVTGDVLAVASDVAVRPTAQLAFAPRQRGSVSYVILLPEMARIGAAAR